MPDPISQFVTWVATTTSASAGGWVAAVTGSTSLGGAVSTAVYYGTTFAIYAGLSYASMPQLPAPSTGFITLRQSRPKRRRAYGRVRLSGPAVLWEASKNFTFNIYAIHDGEIDAFEQFYLQDDLVTRGGSYAVGAFTATSDFVVNELADGRYAKPAVQLHVRTGLATETPYEQVYAPTILLTRTSPGLADVWSADHRGDGVASLCLIAYHGALDKVSTVFPNGEPQPSAVLRAQKLFDPREIAHDEADPDTWEWSDNPALCLLHYLMYDRGYAYAWSLDEVATFEQAKWDRRFGDTIAYWVAAAGVCDELVDLDAGGSEKRYRMGGWFETSNNPSDIINQITAAMDGWLSTTGQGGFVVYAGKFQTPSETLTEAEVTGYEFQRFVAREDHVNEIVAHYTSPEHAYNEVEADPWVDEADIDAVGEVLTEPLSLAWVQSHTQARRLAKRRMTRHRAVARGSLTCNLGARGILGHRWIYLAVAGSPDTMQGLAVEVTRVSFDLAAMAMRLTWIAADPTIDGWTPADDEGEAPPEPTPVEPEPLAVPTIDAVEIVYEPTGSGFDNAHLNLDVTGEARSETWEIRTRLAGTEAWSTNGSADVDPTEAVVLVTGTLAAEAVWEVAVRYFTGGGSSSDWSATATVVIPAGTSEAILDEDGDPILDENGLMIFDEMGA